MAAEAVVTVDAADHEMGVAGFGRRALNLNLDSFLLENLLNNLTDMGFVGGRLELRDGGCARMIRMRLGGTPRVWRLP